MDGLILIFILLLGIYLTGAALSYARLYAEFGTGPYAVQTRSGAIIFGLFSSWIGVVIGLAMRAPGKAVFKF